MRLIHMLHQEKQFTKFMDMFKRLQINISFTKALEQMSTYAKFMKELLIKKKKFIEQEALNRSWM